MRKNTIIMGTVVVFILFIITGCKGSESSSEYTVDNYTAEHTLFNVTYCVPESISKTEAGPNGPCYYTSWGTITVVAENTAEWDSENTIDHYKEKTTRSSFDNIKIDGQTALYYEYNDDGKTGVVVHFNTNRSGCAMEIESNESLEQAKSEFNEFISKVKIDTEKDKAIKYTQKQTVDNITYYLPEESAKQKEGKYYFDGGYFDQVINSEANIDPSKIHNDNFIQNYTKSFTESGFELLKKEKLTIGNSPVTVLLFRLSKESDIYTLNYLMCSNKNLVSFSIGSYAKEDIELKYNEFFNTISIDDSQKSTLSVKKTKSSDYTKKVTIDNVTFYVPENSTEKDGKGSIKYYYYKEDGSFIMTEIGDYTGEESWQSEKFIESFLSGLGGSIQIKSHSKITIYNSPAFAFEGEIKKSGYTGYVQSLAFSSNKHNIIISVTSLDSAEDAKNKIDDVKQKIRIDKTQPYPTGSNKVIYSDSKVKVSFVEFDSIGKYSGPRIKLLVENKSGKTLLIQSRSESVNGFMVDTICSFTVSPGNKAYDYITITKSSLEKNNMSVSDINKIEFKLCIVDDDHWTDSYETKKITINI
ncbi:MAG: hypothetical protein IKH90_08780 [Ruminococcus sp.]|nr:hypothetical protein [Ruminococcus sp.]